MKLVLFTTVLVGTCLALGCAPDTEVTQSDVEKNRKEFSQENYEKAMIAAGKGKELEEEKKRNAEHLQGGQ